ncbi:MAG: CotH kinase family protein [Eubacteriales bacterium]
MQKIKFLSLAGTILLLFGIFLIIKPESMDFNNDVLEKVTFSHNRGFYREPFFLELNTNNANYNIYYTINGSKPDPINNPENTFEYTEPIWIDNREDDENYLSNINTNFPNSWDTWKPPEENIFKSTVIKAAIYKGYRMISDLETHTYFVDSMIYDKYTFPVISISTDENNLFDDEIGIYVPGKSYKPLQEEDNESSTKSKKNEDLIEETEEETNESHNPRKTGNYFQTGSDWERVAYVEYFEPNGNIGFTQNLGLRIHGGGSRSQPQKALRLYAREEYGESTISYDFFPGNVQDEFKRLILRTSGNEWGNTMILDALAQSLLEDMNVETQSSQPAIVFINGEYWGIHNIRERYDEWYFELKYDVPRKDVVILSYDGSLEVGQRGDEQHYKNMINFIKKNRLKEQDNYNKVKKFMDVDNYIEYQISQIYFGNVDWPQNNIKFWRKNTNKYEPDAPYGHDGRWRWLVYDLDCSFGHWGSSYKTNNLEMVSDPNYNDNGSWEGDWGKYTVLFSSLLENEEFSNEFINAFADHLNTTFSKERVINRIDEFETIYKKEIEEHILRWGTPFTKGKWIREINDYRQFAESRPFYLRKHIVEKFDLEGSAKITIDANDKFEGRIQVNGVEIHSSQLPWEGTYFIGVPITIKAEPSKDSKFNRWSGLVESENEEITLDLLNTNNQIFIN